jgi:hypothetical protein
METIESPVVSTSSSIAAYHVDPEPAYYNNSRSADNSRVASINREHGRSTPRERSAPTRPPPVETMYGDQEPSPLSPIRYGSTGSPAVRDHAVRDYELIYSQHDEPTSQRDYGRRSSRDHGMTNGNGHDTMTIPPPPMPSRQRRNPDYDKFDKYETTSASGRRFDGAQSRSRNGGGGGRDNVIGGYSNGVVRSNSYRDLRELENEARPRPPQKKRDRHQTLAYGVSVNDLRDLQSSMTRSYSKTDLSEWRAGNVPIVPQPLSFPRPLTGSNSDLRGFASDMSVGGMGPMVSTVSRSVEKRKRSKSGSTAMAAAAGAGADAGYVSQPVSRRGSEAVRRDFVVFF